jgi:uncharacterized membrane protein
MLSAKYWWLLLLVAQNTSKTLILRLAVGGKGKFLYSAAVLATEGLKATASCVWVLRSGGSPASIVHFLRTEWRNLVRVMVPAGIYNCQQMLEFVALARLEAPVFSVIVQTKLLTTALFTWLVLGRRIGAVQMIALLLLMVGVILAQMRDGQRSHLSHDAETTTGVVATLAIATLSGFAAVYTERVLKHAPLQHHSMASQDLLPCEFSHPGAHAHPPRAAVCPRAGGRACTHARTHTRTHARTRTRTRTRTRGALSHRYYAHLVAVSTPVRRHANPDGPRVAHDHRRFCGRQRLPRSHRVRSLARLRQSRMLRRDLIGDRRAHCLRR